MAKTLRTSGDYTIKTGTGAGGSNTVFLDSKTTRVQGDLVVDGTRTELNTATMSIEDKFIEVNRGNSTADGEDSGIFFNRGSEDHAILFWDADQDDFRLGTTTHNASVSAISNISEKNIKVNLTPAHANHAASKQYVDNTAASTVQITGDDSSVIQTGGSNDTLQLLGGRNISNTTVVGADSITFNLNNNLTDIHSITNSSTNADLELSTNGSGAVIINDILSFSANRSGDPTATAITRMWTQTPGGGGTGVYFNNTSVSSGTAGELISKSKATALAIALG